MTMLYYDRMAMSIGQCAYKASWGFSLVNFFVLPSGTAHPLSLRAGFSPSAASSCERLTYTTVTCYFLQDDPKTNASMFSFTATNFGFIIRTYSNCASSADKTQWQHFADQVAALNAAAPQNIEYKVFYMSGHGESHHNAAESYYGTLGWNCFWSETDSNATVIWRMPASRPKACSRRCQ